MNNRIPETVRLEAVILAVMSKASGIPQENCYPYLQRMIRKYAIHEATLNSKVPMEAVVDLLMLVDNNPQRFEDGLRQFVQKNTVLAWQQN